MEKKAPEEQKKKKSLQREKGSWHKAKPAP